MARTRAAFCDPAGERHGIPTWPWGMAPAHLATLRQLAAEGLRPGGQGVQGQILWRSNRYHAPGGVRVAYLYDRRRAKPKRTPTPAQVRALGKALAARRICPACGHDRGYVIPTTLGVCVPCDTAEHTPPTPDTP